MPKKPAVKPVATLKIKATKGYQLDLIVGDFSGSYQKIEAWAKKQGADLPTRAEGAALYDNPKARAALGENGAMWLKGLHPKYAGCAWSQTFDDGRQYDDPQDLVLLARAVRRTPL